MQVNLLSHLSAFSVTVLLIYEQIGSYHYVSGVDASSSASLAAYINSLTYSFEDTSAWFSKGPTWKVRNGCYWYGVLEFLVSTVIHRFPFSCFNAFSRVDVRIDVKIPGGVHTYVIDLRGERCAPTPWTCGRILKVPQAQCDPRNLAGDLSLRYPSRPLVLR